MSEMLESLVEKNLKNLNFENSLFYAQLLFDRYPSFYALNHLARVYVTNSKFIETYLLLKSKISPDFSLSNFNDDTIFESFKTNFLPVSFNSLPANPKNWNETRDDKKSLVYYFLCSCFHLKKFKEGLNFFNILQDNLVKAKNLCDFCPKINLLVGKFYIHFGILEKAKIHFLKSYNVDPFCKESLDFLARLS